MRLLIARPWVRSSYRPFCFCWLRMFVCIGCCCRRGQTNLSTMRDVRIFRGNLWLLPISSVSRLDTLALKIISVQCAHELETYVSTGIGKRISLHPIKRQRIWEIVDVVVVMTLPTRTIRTTRQLFNRSKYLFSTNMSGTDTFTITYVSCKCVENKAAATRATIVDCRNRSLVVSFCRDCICRKRSIWFG